MALPPRPVLPGRGGGRASLALGPPPRPPPGVRGGWGFFPPPAPPPTPLRGYRARGEERSEKPLQTDTHAATRIPINPRCTTRRNPISSSTPRQLKKGSSRGNDHRRQSVRAGRQSRH